MAFFTDKLIAAGYQRVNKVPGHSALWCKFGKKNDFYYGRGVIVFDAEKYIMTVGAAMHVSEAKVDAMAEAATIIPRHMVKTIAQNPEALVGRRRRRGRRRGLRHYLRKMGPRFKRRINKIAKRMAKSKILTKMRKTYAKVLASPVVSAGIKAAGAALNAWGVPKSVTNLVLNQARNATVDRLRQGGWAGQFERASRPGMGRGSFFKTFAREHGQRHLRQLPKTLRQSLPGGNLLGMLGGKKGGKGGLLGKLGGALGGGRSKGGKGLGKLLGGLGGLLGKTGYEHDVGYELDLDMYDDYIGAEPAAYNGYTRGNDYLRGYYGV